MLVIFMSKPLDYISILGPTAAGKTAVAIELAKHFPIEVVSVDSVSVYQGLDIGSAKPSNDEMRDVRHHLIDCVTLDEIYTVGRFVDDANRLIKEIRSRGKIPLFCGGTMMYMKALQSGYADLPVIPDEVIGEVNRLLEEKGVEALYLNLKQQDPEMAKRIKPGDQQRLVRALSVKLHTGRSLSDYWNQAEPSFKHMDILLMCNDRIKHRDRLADRFDMMLKQGFIDECYRLHKTYGADIWNHPALRSIGYKEIGMHIRKSLPISDVRELAIISSSQYVKRQMTWLNAWYTLCSAKIELYPEIKDINKLAISLVESVIG